MSEVIPAPDLSYYAQRIQNFQEVLHKLDETYTQLIALGDVVYSMGSEAEQLEYEAILEKFVGKFSQIRTVAEGLKLASEAGNSLGLQLPTINLPGGLSAGPLAIPIIAALTAAVVLISWATGMFNLVGEFAGRMQTYIALNFSDSEQKTNAIVQIEEIKSKTRIATQNADANPITAVANAASSAIKWVVIGGIAYFIWKQYGKQ